ncbi:hypothetical protein PMm318_A47510 [Pseudomonas moorei]
MNQNRNASPRLIGAGLVSSAGLFGEGVRLKRMFLVRGRFEPLTVAMKRGFEQSVLPDRCGSWLASEGGGTSGLDVD